MAAIREDTAMPHTLGVLRDEGTNGGSSLPGDMSCRDLI